MLWGEHGPPLSHLSPFVVTLGENPQLSLEYSAAPKKGNNICDPASYC